MLLLAFFSLVGTMYAQKTVTGTVTDESGLSFPGVAVSVKGTTVGTMTKADGTYSVEVPAGSEFLVFKFIGMKTAEMKITGDVVNVAMMPEDTELDEVVVTALGVSREKKSLGYAVQEVGGDEMNRARNDNVINALSGKAAGVQIKSNTNMGGSSNILIRGSSSITGDNQALFVVDGVPINNRNSNTGYQSVGGSGYDYGNPVSDINPNNIESVSVLKGAAATALYGSRAANGVIMITTKKGKKAKGDQKNLSVSVNSSTMFHMMDKETFPEHQELYGAGYGPYYSGTEYPGLYYYDMDGDGTDDYVVPSTEDASRGSAFTDDIEVFTWESFFPESPNYMTKMPYEAGANGPDYFFETGRTLTNSIDVSGGTSVATFRLAYTNTDQTGMMPNSERKKNDLNFSGSYDVYDNVTVSASANYSNSYTKGRNHTGYSDNIMSMFRQWYNVGVDVALQEQYYNDYGTNVTWNPNSENNIYPIYWDNPYWQRYENYQSDERDRLIGYTKIDWDITDDLSFMGRYSLDYYSFLQEERKAVGSVSGGFGVDFPDARSGYARKNILFSETNFDALLKYNKNLSDAVNLNALVGTNMRRTRLDQVRLSTNGGLAVPDVYALSNSVSTMLPPEEDKETVGVDGVFASVSLGLNNMIFIDGTVRRDVSSTLPEGENAYIYPSGSLSFLFSEALDMSWMNLGKLRFNYAQVGNDAPWSRVQDAFRIVAPFGANTLVRFPSYKNNPELKPELSSSLEAGLEFSMFNNRVGLDFAAYKTSTVDQVVPLAVSYTTGFSSKYVNIGEVQNQGIEILLRLTPVRTNNFSWDIGFNWAKNVNEVIDLGGDIDNLQIASLQGGVTINAREGEPYGTIQGTDFVYAPDGQKVISGGGYYEHTDANDVVLGNVQPDWTAGITNSFTYKSLTASFLIDAQMGGQIFSLDMWYGMATGLYPETVETNDLGNQERDDIIQNDDGTYDAASGGILLEGVVGTDTDGDGEYDEYDTNTTRISGFNYGADGYATSPNARYIYDATYVKLREASISYALPSSMLSGTFFSGASIGVQGSNLAILYKDLPYADPEASQGAGNIQGWQSGVFPTARNIGFNINLTF
ncbi:MAG: SusC/RagA family TonB-linked outer membrane protein [Bacteroidota bacterium]|nr:SusC/RagA family TonB-linked outer membrane protein [Bacteroidota bacterium]